MIHLTYGSAGGDNDILDRLAAIKDDSSGSPGDTLASYEYLGLSRIVTEDYEEPDVRLESFFDSAYSGWDRFGRVVDQRWYDYGAAADRDRYTYGYDRASNRTYRENTTSGGKDEFYTYDGVHQLQTFDRGDLNAGKTAISGTPVREEDWGLDMTGNWSDYTRKTSGTTDLDQDRTHNKVNEVTDITETVGKAWATPAHDRNGNTTTVPKPAALDSGLTLKFDGWNRLAEVQDGATVIGRYEYDGLNRRIKRHLDSQAPGSPDGVDAYIHYFFNQDWQLLETRDTTTESDQPENLQPKYQYLWSPRYIDAPILRDENTDTDGLCDDGRIYYLGDANFNVTALVDTAGDALERYLYEPYGVVTIHDGTWSTLSTSGEDNLVMFAGRERDTESQFYSIRARVYQPTLGRWLSRDPAGFVDSLNRYQFVVGRPTTLIDPTGLAIFPGVPSEPKKKPDPRKDPSTWYSEICKIACEEARKKVGKQRKGKGKGTDVLGQVWCKKDPKRNIDWLCACVFDIELETGEKYDWDECPEISWCIFQHELGHIKHGGVCSRSSDPCRATWDAEVVEEYHEKQLEPDRKCHVKALLEINKLPESDPRKAKCLKLADVLLSEF